MACLRTFASVGLLLALVGCAGRAGQVPTLDELRARAAENPRSAPLQRELALSELFHPQGDPARAPEALQRALGLDPSNPELLIAHALHEDVHGHTSKALASYLLALERSAAAPVLRIDEVEGISVPHAYIAELALAGISGLDGGAPGYATHVRPVLERVLDAPGLAAPARYLAANQLIDLAFRRSDRAAAQALAASVGCLTELQVAGPFGPYTLLGFDQRHAATPGKPLAKSYDLGPGRGTWPTRTLGARGCAVSVGGGPIAEGGVSYVQGALRVPAAGSYLIRLHTGSHSALYVDGREVLVVDGRRALTPDVTFQRIELSAGAHEVTLKLAARHPSPTFALSFMPARELDLRATALPKASAPNTLERYLRAAIALGRGDALAAREALAHVRVDAKASTYLRLQRASLLLVDPLLPADQREDEARRQLLAALARDRELWGPSVQLANMMAGNGRNTEAIAALRELLQRFPEVPGIALTLAAQLREKGWIEEADAIVSKLRARIPDACPVISAELEALRERQREAQAAPLVEELMRCEGQANARYALTLRERDWSASLAELSRLESMDPPQNRYAWLLAHLSLAKNRGDEAVIERSLADLRARYPRSVTSTLETIDRKASRGELGSALSTLQGDLAREPASLAELHSLAPVLGGSDIMEPYRRNGRDAITRFEANKRSYDGPQVLVFDYMAVRVLPDLSSLSIVHTIQKAQSDEAVEDLAEVKVPDGARVLTLRLHKPDGQLLEPDAIEGKEAISLPKVASGDYVELEYLLTEDPPEGIVDGYLGDRFYFKSFEIPFDHSEIVFALPKDAKVELDPRGPAPRAVESSLGDVRVLTFAVDESAAIKPEPNAVAAREYLPSVRIGIGATWHKFVQSLREGLADRDVYDPELAAFALAIAGEPKAGNALERVRKLYAWVLENVEDGDDLFSQAAVMMRSRSGNRTRVLRYLLGMIGVRSTLALVRNAASDNTPSEMADGDTYEHLLLEVDVEGKPLWLFTAERHAPLGYVPALLRGQPALRVDASTSRVTVPAAASGQELRRLVLDVTLAGDGSARVEAVETLHGNGAVSWRDNLESIPEAELEHRFEEEYVARLFPGARLRKLRTEGLDRADPELVLRYTFEVGAFGRAVGEQWALPPVLQARLSQTFAQASTRTSTELIAAPLELDLVLRFHLPGGRVPATSRAPEQLEAAIPGRPRFESTLRKEGDALVLERKLRMPVMRVTPEHYAAFTAFCQRADAVESRELLVRLR